MSDVIYPELGLEAMKAMIESKLQEINCTLERGMDNIKIEVISQVKTLHINMEAPSNRPNIITRMLTSSDLKDSSDAEVENLKHTNQQLEDKYRMLEKERDQLKQLQAQHNNKIRELHQKLSTVEQESRAQLGSMELKNRQLQEQTQAFRDIIINRGSSDHDAVDDSTIINDYVFLREQIQRIALKYYKQADPYKPEPLKSKILEKKQKRFLSMWDKKYTAPQLRSRTRAMIFELLADDILQPPIFGLDDIGGSGKGVLEQELVDLEMALASTLDKGGQASDLSSWRIQTIKLGSQLPQPSTPSRPTKVATRIYAFMEPLFPTSPQKVQEELYDQLFKLCLAAYKLALTLRKSKDVYRFELPGTGERIDPETMEPQETEADRGTREEDLRVAYVMSGVLVKVVEIDGQRLVLEKAHVVVD
ncbi:hypothetical protein ACMFMG_006723 [Clarireedia jacksonii]